MLTIAIIIAAIVVVVLLSIVVVWQVRTRNFRPTADKNQQRDKLNASLEPTGFAYDLEGDYFYALMNSWQREMGYCRLYDEGAPLFNMIMDCEPVTFSYGGKRWLIELWKGQYGITTGAEIGIYNTSREDIDTEKFKGTFYESAADEERLQMSFVLKRKGRKIISRNELHWWLTGFKLGKFSKTSSLTMNAKITFPNKEMCAAFVGGLYNIGYRRREFSVKYTTVTVHFRKPHTPQPISQINQRFLVQMANKNNCALYNLTTAKYSDTMDKIEYIEAAVPELYQFFLHSLYARGLYEAFEWLIDLARNHHEKPEPPKPCPPEPCPPEPCPPEPCPPEPCPPEPCPPEPPCPPEAPCSPEPPCLPNPPYPPCPPEPPCQACPTFFPMGNRVYNPRVCTKNTWCNNQGQCNCNMSDSYEGIKGEMQYNNEEMGRQMEISEDEGDCQDYCDYYNYMSGSYDDSNKMDY